MSFTPLPAHPLADLFPMLEQEDIERLANDICTFGQREPIIVLDGKVLDGRNRQAACVFADIEPVYRAYEGDDPLNFVLSLNLHRRHLTESQRAMVAAKLATWTLGMNQSTSSQADLPVWRAAQLLNVSPRIVKMAKNVIHQGIPDLVEAVNSGRIRVRKAEPIAKQGRLEQQAALRLIDSCDAVDDPYSKIRIGGRTLRSLDLGNVRALLAALEEQATTARAILSHAGSSAPDTMVADVISLSTLMSLTQGGRR